MAASVKFAGIGIAPAADAIDPGAVKAAYDALFSGALAADDLDAWYRELTQRIAVAEAAIDVARRQRAQILAHQHDSLGRSYAAIAATKPGLSPQRASQLAAKGRPHITPVDTSRFAS